MASTGYGIGRSAAYRVARAKAHLRGEQLRKLEQRLGDRALSFGESDFDRSSMAGNLNNSSGLKIVKINGSKYRLMLNSTPKPAYESGPRAGDREMDRAGLPRRRKESDAPFPNC